MYVHVCLSSRPDNDQQKRIAQLTVELKMLLDSGKVSEMDAVVADYVHTVSIYQCLGENRLEFFRRLSSADPLHGQC